MRTYHIEQEVLIAAPVKEVWAFFSDPHNLEKITPQYMDFRVTSCPDVTEIYDGMIIEYRIKPMLKIPVKWITLIKKVIPLQCFVDTQLAGPYALWEHTHTFTETHEGTYMRDSVRYALPLGPLGVFAHALFVRKQLEHVFSFRTQVIRQVFPG